jgi:hypothetical protein
MAGSACGICTISIGGLGMLKASAVATRVPDKPELYEELVTSDRLTGYEMTRRFYEIGSFELAEANDLLSLNLR